jgi:large subunit ribosomal protein L22
MGKQARDRDLPDTQAQAILRNLRVSPRKLNLVAEQIRGMPAGAARATLSFSKRRIAKDVRKVLDSAIANAENNHNLDVDRLVVDSATVGRSAVMKRFHARGRGRSSRIEKWFSHITIIVRERARDAEAKPARPPRRRPEAPKQEAA